MINKISLKHVVAYKVYFSFIFIFLLSGLVFFTYSQLFYVKPIGLIFCLALVLLIYIWVNFLLSKNLELTIVKNNLVISDKKKEIFIDLKEIKGFYFHDEAAFIPSERTKKGLASSIKIYYENGRIFEANEYSALFLSEKYDQDKNEKFKAFLETLLKELDFSLVKKNRFRSFGNTTASWYER